jgi:hypothetical protein
VVVGASVVVVGTSVVVVGTSVVAVVVEISCDVGSGNPDNVTTGGSVWAAADEPCCEHEASTSAAAERSSGSL